VNIPAPGGVEEQAPSSPPPSSSPDVVFSDLTPDAMQVWPVIAIVGVLLALALTALVLASVALARRGR
jgi:hypothetical protein